MTAAALDALERYLKASAPERAARVARYRPKKFS